MNSPSPLKTHDASSFGRVGLLVGGDSAERDVSLDGGKAVYAALQRRQVSVRVFDGSSTLFEAIGNNEIDRVFNLMHGPGGEDGAIQGALQLMSITITGSGLLGSALSMDKIRSKWVWEHKGINTPPFLLLKRDQQLVHEQIADWGWPLFVKPSGLGSSIGISKVMSSAEMPAAIDLARIYGETVIIEPEIKGSEYFAGIIGEQVLPLIRIETPREFYDYTAKYESDDTQYFCPCGLSMEVEQVAQTVSLQAFEALDCSGWGRVDFILDHDGKAWFLEVNTVPGMTGHSLVPQAAEHLGIGFDELVWRILETSL